jgi:cob(I)alamin adenosyltransferase
MTKYFTGYGDDGTTGLLGEGRTRKDDPRLEAVGAIDEANATLGVARAHCKYSSSAGIILTVQKDLYNLMAELAATPENAEKFRKIDQHRVSWLEDQIKNLELGILPTKEFIVPGDSPNSAFLDLARTIVRRAERRVASLYLNHGIENADLLRYLNRLSSLCFILELVENQEAGFDKPTLAKES